MKLAAVLLAAGLAVSVQAGEPQAAIFPLSIPVDRPAMEELTSGLRARVKTLGLNGLTVSSTVVSRALLLLPADRGRAGALSFEIEGGSRPGIYQCEALGRGLTYNESREGLVKSLIGGATLYYIPPDKTDGATIPGVYDLHNITPEEYDIVFPNSPEELAADADILPSVGNGPRPYFTVVWRHWYSRAARAMPVDMVWAEGFQPGTQGEGIPVFERKPVTRSEAGKLRQAAQLAHNPRYYYGPHGRTGFAVHTDRWEDRERGSDPKYSGRHELHDFRYRDTNGCVKLRPACLAVFNEFISGQSALGRRVQLEVREVFMAE